jgi:hypothetical protein
MVYAEMVQDGMIGLLTLLRKLDYIYEFLAVYVDDLARAMKNPKEFCRHLGEEAQVQD